MIRTLRISFDLKNTYRVNAILYWIRRIPLISRLLPANPYRGRGWKGFANFLSVLGEVFSFMFGKLLYFGLVFFLAGVLGGGLPRGDVFLHSMVFLTLIGGLINTSLFDSTMTDYYAIMLMNMDGREYTLSWFGYDLLKYALGYVLFGLIFGILAGLSPWVCLSLPLGVVGVKLTFAARSLGRYERTGREDRMSPSWKISVPLVLLLLAAAYGLPLMGVVLPQPVGAALLACCLGIGLIGLRRILRFTEYRSLYRKILLDVPMTDLKGNETKLAVEAARETLSEDAGISSKRKGFEYLNELFVKRHRKTLWNVSIVISVIAGAVCLIALLIQTMYPEVREVMNRAILHSFPSVAFLMYFVNRGMEFTRMLYINCDHSLLTYPFFRKSGNVLRLFQIRLREIVKINLLPAAVIGVGMDVLLFATGGSGEPLHYVLVFLSILFLSVFFSIHYLTIYYLLQPYNRETEIKSMPYKILTGLTYLVCFEMGELGLSLTQFGIGTVGFCILYCGVASLLVYFLAPRTFRVRN